MDSVLVSYSSMEQQDRLTEYLYRRTGINRKPGEIRYGGKLSICIIDLKNYSFKSMNITGAIWFPGKRFKTVDDFIGWDEKRVNKTVKDRLLIHIPHSGMMVSDEFLKRLLIPKEEFDRLNVYESDYGMHCLIDKETATSFVFPYSRLMCDVERFDDKRELMEIYGRGIVYTCFTNHKTSVRVDDEYRKMILDNYYYPHHRALEGMIEEKLKIAGSCFIIDLHSFSESYVCKTDKDFRGFCPDICIGINDFVKSKEALKEIQILCNRYGYTSSVNYPYSGSLIPDRYADDDRVDSIMIEVNKRLYLGDGVTTEGILRLKEFMKEVCIRLSLIQ